MKNIFLIILLFTSTLAKCQIQSNIITQKEFDDIKINNVKFSSLKNTLGKEFNVKSLFGEPKKVEKDNNPIYEGDIFSIDFYYSGLEFSFYEKEVSNIKITSNSYLITIKGITVTIGDNISKLGMVNFNTNKDGSKSIIYQYCDGCNNYIYIHFNQASKKITEIGFIELT
ncbi:hypothetical protein [uncultured Tenacibaculum sp.]|uniref:hypothetical protein n=1 Tax=uncultured Tenacibaculum sp. TaxID=174713 RepID=UPI002621F393|nr:hypothetical protein [uncultured Tenacibaculum sp.]